MDLTNHYEFRSRVGLVILDMNSVVPDRLENCYSIKTKVTRNYNTHNRSVKNGNQSSFSGNVEHGVG